MDDCANLFNGARTAPTIAVPRWKRKGLIRGEAIREPLSPVSSNRETLKTPKNTPGKTDTRKPTRTPGKAQKCGSPNAPSDRFIPNRWCSDSQLGHHLLMKDSKSTREENDDEADDYSERMRQNMDEDVNELNHRILAMRVKPPRNNEGEAAMKMVFAKSKPTPAKKSSRHVPGMPEKILDAPEIIDDYYLSLLDWGSCGLLAVPLYDNVFLWNACSSSVEQLFSDQIHGQGITISSVKWIGVGSTLAVGLSNGSVELWDAESKRRVRAMSGHASRIGCMSWNEHILSSGCRSGSIHNHDVREARHHVTSLNYHTQEVCGLEWSPDGKMLASGANDNFLCIWDVNLSSTGVSSTPMQIFSEHQAAVKAVSWCPWQRNILASGGGTSDRHVRVWNVSTGVCLQSQDTNSQVSGILWSGNYKEIMCSHGNQMTIWRYPSMIREAELAGHEGRILNICQSPDGVMVASTGNDETLRIWRCFEVETRKVKPEKKAFHSEPLWQSIR